MIRRGAAGRPRLAENDAGEVETTDHRSPCYDGPMRSVKVVAALAAMFAAACGERSIGFSVSSVTLGELAADSGCSTAGTEGIAAQLIDEWFCLTEGALVRFTPREGIRLATSRVHPYLSPAGRDRLWTAARSGDVVIASALRTIAEQYVLWRNCPVAADPGRSNHETGRAIDVSNHATVGGALVRAGFSHPLPSTDPAHFEAPGDDLRRFSVLSFQRLWNANHPGDHIAEDGVAGTETLRRIVRAPAAGFAVGRVCGVMPDPELRAELVRQSFPSAAEGALELPAGTTREVWLELKNTGRLAWVPNETFLATTEPRGHASPLRDSSWPTASRAATVPRRTMRGEVARFIFTVRAPDAQGHTLEHFGLFQTNVGWAGDRDQGGPADDRLKLRVRVGPPPYAATLVASSFSRRVPLRPGEQVEGTFELRNVGSLPWRPNEVFLATTNPRDRESDFASSAWITANRAATVDRVVQPGEAVRVALRLRAPDGRLGDFDERFGLVREGVAWFGDDDQGGPADGALGVRGRIVPNAIPIPPLPQPATGGDAGVGAPPPVVGAPSGCTHAGSAGIGFLAIAAALMAWLAARRGVSK
jgi:hypothetical protein